MSERKKVGLNRVTWARLVNIIKALSADPVVGRKAKFYFASLVIFLLVINGLNVINSYVGRDFMTAIELRDRAGFGIMALLYVAVFAALTAMSVSSRFVEESLGLLWRKWLTWRVVRRYADHRVYFRLAESGEVGNPDQRIADDIRTFTATLLSFTLMVLNGILTALSFSGVLISISPTLFLVAVAYATVGTYLTIQLGKPLVRLNYDQLDKEADFRATLLHLRENADMVSLSRREGQLLLKGKERLEDLAENFRKIIRINRNVGFFVTGYNWLIQIIPALIIAPLFIAGEVEFGVITQSAMAFTQLLGAFSLIVTQFQSVSSFAAVITRLGVMTEASRQAEKAEIAAVKAATDNWRDEDRIVYRGLTLYSVRSERLLIKALEGEITVGCRLLVQGPDETARASLFRATAGIWPVAAGAILRPPLERVLFVTERPYVCPSTLRELFIRPRPEVKPQGPDVIAELEPEQLFVAEHDILEALAAVGLEGLPERFGGFDRPRDWDSILSMAEQQLLVVARVLRERPTFVFLDRPGTALADDQVIRVLELFRDRAITYVVFEEFGQRQGYFDQILELRPDGGWDWRRVEKRAAAQSLTVTTMDRSER